MEIIDVPSLASYLRQTIPDYDLSAELYVRLANGIVSEITGDLDPVPVRVEAITLEAAARAFRGSDGYTSVTTSFDDTSKTWRREVDADEAGVYLTAAEKAELRGEAGQTPAGAFTIRPWSARC